MGWGRLLLQDVLWLYCGRSMWCQRSHLWSVNISNSSNGLSNNIDSINSSDSGRNTNTDTSDPSTNTMAAKDDHSDTRSIDEATSHTPLLPMMAPMSPCMTLAPMLWSGMMAITTIATAILPMPCNVNNTNVSLSNNGGNISKHWTNNQTCVSKMRTTNIHVWKYIRSAGIVFKWLLNKRRNFSRFQKNDSLYPWLVTWNIKD